METSDSPHASVLSVLLFACFINDVISCVRNSSVNLFADDLQLYLWIYIRVVRLAGLRVLMRTRLVFVYSLW
jgi:hypothetical protein